MCVSWSKILYYYFFYLFSSLYVIYSLLFYVVVMYVVFFSCVVLGFRLLWTHTEILKKTITTTTKKNLNTKRS